MRLQLQMASPDAFAERGRQMARFLLRDGGEGEAASAGGKWRAEGPDNSLSCIGSVPSKLLADGVT